MNDMEKDNTNRNSTLPNSIEEDENLESKIIMICTSSDAETK